MNGHLHVRKKMLINMNKKKELIFVKTSFQENFFENKLVWIKFCEKKNKYLQIFAFKILEN